MTSTTDFYDALAPYYHLIFEDWDASIAWQGAQLDALIRRCGPPGASSVLDVACGIGTQALGLAAKGYDVTASDLSPGAVERARREARSRGLELALSVADMSGVHDHHGGTFDVVLCADNALPHLLNDDNIAQALKAFFACTKPGGLCAITVRDYDAIERRDLELRPHRVRVENGVRYVLFQVWAWRGPLYDVNFYVVKDDGSTPCETHVMRATYYALSIPTLLTLMRQAGFERVERIDDAFNQPVVIGRRPE